MPAPDAFIYPWRQAVHNIHKDLRVADSSGAPRGRERHTQLSGLGFSERLEEQAGDGPSGQARAAFPTGWDWHPLPFAHPGSLAGLAQDGCPGNKGENHLSARTGLIS